MNTLQKSATDNLPSTARYSCVDEMAFPRLEKDYNLQSFCPSMGIANSGFPWGSTFGVRCLNTVTRVAVGGCSKLQYPLYNFSGAAEAPGSRFSMDQSPGFHANNVYAYADSEKRFLIFDKSGDKTSLFFSPSINPQSKPPASVAPAAAAKFPCEDVAGPVNPQLNEEKWDENDLIDGKSKMDEDVEEINALLYSDSDDEDEVTSKEHFPFIIESGHDQYGPFKDFTGEAGITYGSPKRRKLLGGRYTESSSFIRKSPMILDASSNYEDDAGSNNHGHDDIDLSQGEKKAKIRQALQLLQIIVPDANTKDPLSILNKAIVYLKSMKAEVEARGLESTTATCA